MKLILPIVFAITAACFISGNAQQRNDQLSRPSSLRQARALSSRLNMSPVERALAPQWPIPPSEAGIKSEARVKKEKGADTDEAKARALFNEAMGLVRAEKFEQALAIFREVEKLVPRDLATEMNIGICLMYLDRAGEAVSAFEKATAISPDHAAAHLMVCSSRAASGDRSGAMCECREAVRLSNGAAEYKTQLGKLLLLDGNRYEALEILNTISPGEDSQLALLGPLADLYMLAGEYDRAAGVYEQIKQRWPNVTLTYYRLSYVYEFLDRPQQSISAAQKYAWLKPASAFAWVNLGERQNHSGFFEESLPSLSKAISLDPANGDAYLLLSDAYQVLGDKDNALKNLEFAYRSLPPDFEISYHLGRSLTEYGRMADAVPPLERANKLRPNDPLVMTSLGLSYFESNQFDPAIEILTRVDQMKPNNEIVQMFLRVAKARKKIVEEFDELLDALKKDPGDLELRDRVASGYRYRGMWKEAENEYLKAIELYPKEWKAYTRLAGFYSDTAHLAEALDYLQRSAAIGPNHVTYVSIAKTLEKLGRLDEAIEAARRAVQMKATVYSTLSLGDLLKKKGDRTGAMEQFQAAFAMEPGNPAPNFDLAWLYLRNGNKEGAQRHYRILQTIVPNETADLKRAITAHFGPSD